MSINLLVSEWAGRESLMDTSRLSHTPSVVHARSIPGCHAVRSRGGFDPSGSSAVSYVSITHSYSLEIFQLLFA